MTRWCSWKPFWFERRWYLERNVDFVKQPTFIKKNETAISYQEELSAMLPISTNARWPWRDPIARICFGKILGLAELKLGSFGGWLARPE